jgi:hypothetical protein
VAAYAVLAALTDGPRRPEKVDLELVFSCVRPRERVRKRGDDDIPRRLIITGSGAGVSEEPGK